MTSEEPIEHVQCPRCSEAGGADRAIYHEPPVCSSGSNLPDILRAGVNSREDNKEEENPEVEVHWCCECDAKTVHLRSSKFCVECVGCGEPSESRLLETALDVANEILNYGYSHPDDLAEMIENYAQRNRRQKKHGQTDADTAGDSEMESQTP